MSNFFTEIERHIWEKSVIYRGVIEEKRQLQKAVLKRLIWWGFTVFTILEKEMGFWRLINIYWKSESWEYKKEKEENFLAFLFSVPGAGIEPARVLPHRFLRPTRLPIPPPGLKISTNHCVSFASAKVIIFLLRQRKILYFCKNFKIN